MKKNVSHIFLSVICFILALGTLVLMILQTLDHVMALPQFIQVFSVRLTAVFLQSSWFLPAYLFFCAFLLLSAERSHPYHILIPFTAIPFATIVLFLHFTFGNADAALNRWILTMVPMRTASIIVLFLFIIEALLFCIWSMNWFGRDRGISSSNYVLQHRSSSGHESEGTASVRDRSPRSVKRVASEDASGQAVHPHKGADDDHPVHEMTLSFPAIPDLPRLASRSVPPSVSDASSEKPVISTLDDVSGTMASKETEQTAAPFTHSTMRHGSEGKKGSGPSIHGKLRRIEPVKEPEDGDMPTMVIGSHTVPVLPPEDPEFDTAHSSPSAGFTERLRRISGTVGSFRDITDIEASDTSSGTASSSLLNSIGYVYPPEEVLDTYPDISSEIDHVTEAAGKVLMQTLLEFKIDAQLTGIQKGPVVTMYEILPAPGIRVQAITNLTDNIALQLAASRVRMVAPIPGKQAVGIEVPNKKRSIVSFREMLNEVDRKRDYEIPVVLGKDITGKSQVIDLTKTPHLLIAGATGSGKSVCVNSLICSILFRRSPKDVRLMLVDPKIVELKLYNDIPHLLTPVITDSKKAIKALQYCIYEMERRYDLLDQLNVRDIKTYNRRIREQGLAKEKLPYIVLVIDEFADLMTTTGKEMESYLARLAAMARAVGIHLVLATQRPSTNVITGIIKANIPSRVAFMVTSNTDSRIILDQSGAEKLLGRGDMLFSSSWDPNLVRLQGAFLSEEEVERIVDEVCKNGEPDYLDEELFWDEDDDEDTPDIESGESDPLMEEALQIIYTRKSASASYLQRRLKIGYNRAARLIEEMEDRGIIGPARGSMPREILRMGDIDN